MTCEVWLFFIRCIYHVTWNNSIQCLTRSRRLKSIAAVYWRLGALVWGQVGWALFLQSLLNSAAAPMFAEEQERRAAVPSKSHTKLSRPCGWCGRCYYTKFVGTKKRYIYLYLSNWKITFHYFVLQCQFRYSNLRPNNPNITHWPPSNVSYLNIKFALVENEQWRGEPPLQTWIGVKCNKYVNLLDFTDFFRTKWIKLCY